MLRWRGRLALIALGEESKCVNLMDEVGHASPTPEPKPNHQHPHHHEGVDHIHGRPVSEEERRLLCSILQYDRRKEGKNNNKLVINDFMSHVNYNKMCVCLSTYNRIRIDG